MKKFRTTAENMIDALIGGGDDPEQANYAETIQAIEDRCAAIAMMIDTGHFASMNVEAASIARKADDLCRFALEPDSGIPQIGVDEIAQNIRELKALCAALAVVPTSGGKDYAGKRFDELIVLVEGLKELAPL